MPPSTDDPILTTRQAAELLGVSVRTAQNWIETGALGSWKTPGGHRRIRRSAVQAMLAREALDESFVSAEVMVLATSASREHYQRVLAPAGEFVLTVFEDTFAALLAVGASSPALFITEIGAHQPERLEMLQRVVGDPVLGHLKILAISPLSTFELVARCGGRGRLSAMTPADAAADLATWVRGALMGGDAMAPGAAFAPDTPVSYPRLANEASRAAAVDRSGLLDTPPETSFDHVTWLAGHLLKTPMAVLSLLASDRQWFKSRLGLEETGTPRELAFCNHTIMQKGVFLVRDATADTRFVDHPMVRDARFRFYAGVPVVDDQGYALGALCVLDPEPRTLDAQEERALLALASVASSEIRLRIQGRRLRAALSALAGEGRRAAANGADSRASNG